ncbi:hypothetical protein SAMN04489716_8644 [Actinoplanes derwentensis]|uniref:Uncharacterized protein n=1 Tax=Actinoplanes derwentensis TaxID=113562 RepID=A0A1H2D928_9ACTN|nr:hypothetical protein SAMN04489716_8644 [Actinoplanes derwentensis]
MKSGPPLLFQYGIARDQNGETVNDEPLETTEKL